MKFCKYCKKPISDDAVWSPDREGNGYHLACLCEMEFRSGDKQIYDNGRADILDKIRAEIEETYMNITYQDNKDRKATWGLRKALEIIDKYKADRRNDGNEEI